MIRTLLLGRMDWTDRHQGLMLAAVAMCCALALAYAGNLP